jgi:hypothetical protein
LVHAPPRLVGAHSSSSLLALGWAACVLLVLGWVATLLLCLFVSQPSSPASSCWLGLDSSTSAPIRCTTLVALVVDLPRPRRHRLSPSQSSRVSWLSFHRRRGGCHCGRVRESSCLRVYRRRALLVISGLTHPAWWLSSCRRWAQFAGVGLRWGDSSPLLLVVSPLLLLIVWPVLLLLVPPPLLFHPASFAPPPAPAPCPSFSSHRSSVSPLCLPSSSSLRRSSVEQGEATHIPLERGGAAEATSSLLRESRSRIEGAHIPQRRGGAHRRFDGRFWRRQGRGWWWRGGSGGRRERAKSM